MTWTYDYELGQDVVVYHQSKWCRGAIASKRTRSVMAFLGKHGYVNVHDSRNIKPWEPPTSKQDQLLTLNVPPLFDS
jgi:hypothetical protein